MLGYQAISNSLLDIDIQVVEAEQRWESELGVNGIFAKENAIPPFLRPLRRKLPVIRLEQPAFGGGQLKFD